MIEHAKFPTSLAEWQAFQLPLSWSDFPRPVMVSESGDKQIYQKAWGEEHHFTPLHSEREVLLMSELDTLENRNMDVKKLYEFKRLRVKPGGILSGQVHDKKIETQVLERGRCMRIIQAGNGEIVAFEMEQGKGYTNRRGEFHSLWVPEEWEDWAEIFEASTPEEGFTYRLVDAYGRTTETEQSRVEERLHTRLV